MTDTGRPMPEDPAMIEEGPTPVDPTTAGALDADEGMADAEDPAMEAEEDRTVESAEDYAKRAQYGQTGDMLDTTMGNMGGAGASGAGPDISRQSGGMPGNHSDMPSGSR